MIPMRLLLPLAGFLLAIGPVCAEEVAIQPGDPLLSDNLLSNGGFEQSEIGPVPPGKVPAGWGQEAYGPDGQLEIVPLSRPGSSGKQCLGVNTSVSDKRSGVYSNYLPVDP
jgi:hypothetical protein